MNVDPLHSFRSAAADGLREMKVRVVSDPSPAPLERQRREVQRLQSEINRLGAESEVAQSTLRSHLIDRRVKLVACLLFFAMSTVSVALAVGGLVAALIPAVPFGIAAGVYAGLSQDATKEVRGARTDAIKARHSLAASMDAFFSASHELDEMKQGRRI